MDKMGFMFLFKHEQVKSELGLYAQQYLNNEDMEESVDAIAKELEKSDSEVKKAGKKDKSPKKGKKQQTDGENKEESPPSLHSDDEDLQVGLELGVGG